MTRPCAFLGAILIACALAVPAQAAPIVGQTLVAGRGDVIVALVSRDSSYYNDVFFEGPLGAPIPLFGFSTPIGTAFNLGAFAEGTELVFRLFVQQTGNAFYSGSGARNLDGEVHAVIREVAGKVIVGFEDLYGGGDRDYNDMVFALSNASVWSPSSGGGGTPGTSGSSGTGSAPGPGSGTGTPAPTTTAPATTGSGAPAVAVIDEPSSLLLLSTGLGAVVFLMRRRQSFRR